MRHCRRRRKALRMGAREKADAYDAHSARYTARPTSFPRALNTDGQRREREQSHGVPRPLERAARVRGEEEEVHEVARL